MLWELPSSFPLLGLLKTEKRAEKKDNTEIRKEREKEHDRETLSMLRLIIKPDSGKAKERRRISNGHKQHDDDL